MPWQFVTCPHLWERDSAGGSADGCRRTDRPFCSVDEPMQVLKIADLVLARA
jgi:hypothetical protein